MTIPDKPNSWLQKYRLTKHHVIPRCLRARDKWPLAALRRRGGQALLNQQVKRK